MKLSSHERKIVSKINAGEVFDIPSYLHVFDKGRNRSYDMNAIEHKFNDSENGKKYKVMKDGNSLYTPIEAPFSGIMGKPIHTKMLFPRSKTNIADDEWTLCGAKLVGDIPPLTYTYKGQEFTIDFQKGAFVADNFKDILTFIRLWSYMQREALVFDVSKPVSNEEISMLCELIPCSEKSKPAEINIEFNSCANDSGKDLAKYTPVTDIHQTVPTRCVEEFIDAEWKLNEDHLLMCRDFLGKRMYPTAASHRYAANHYRTPEEVHRGINTIVAVVALLISVISFSISLLYPSNTYQPVLDNLTQQLFEIQIVLDDINTDQISVEGLDQIYSKLESIEEDLAKKEHNGIYSDIDELSADIKEIRNMLAEYLTPIDNVAE